VGHYSKDCPKSKMGNGGSRVIALNANLAQVECDRLIFLKGKIVKQDVLCLLDIEAFHNFITRKNVKRMELHLEELKAPIKVHFADGVPHLITSQAKEVFLQLRNWRGNVNLPVFTLGGMGCVLGMEFITRNNVLIERHNRLVIISSKSGIKKSFGCRCCEEMQRILYGGRWWLPLSPGRDESYESKIARGLS